MNGSNFISNPAHTPTLIQCIYYTLLLCYICVIAILLGLYTLICIPAVPSLLSVSINSDMDNPIPYGLSPTLSCVVSLSLAVDIEVEIITEWRRPSYGLNEYTTTEPVLNSSAEVPIYTSRATLNASGTYYDSGQYNCSVVVNPVTNCDFIHSFHAVSSQPLSGKSIKV